MGIFNTASLTIIFCFKQSLFLKILLFICGCAGSSLLLGFFSSCGQWALLSGCSAWAPERKLSSCSQAELLRSTRDLPPSVIEPGSLHWQADSSPLSHQGSTFSSPFEDSSLPWAKEERERDLNCSSLSSFCFVKEKNSRVRAQVLDSTHL